MYAGKNAEFTFYEDDGVSYGYEKGEYSTIHVRWEDNARIFTLDDREGSFPGMLKTRTFCVGVVDPENPVPYDPDSINSLCISYDGFNSRIGL